MTTREVMDLLAARYAPPAYAFFAEVHAQTGYNAGGSADALALSLWPSRGIELHGFEVKVSRSDWLRELKNPAKADDFVRACHRWWLVVGDESIVQPGELPAGWGLLVPRGGALKCKTEPDRREAEFGLPFVASLCRRVHQTTVPKRDVDAKLKVKYDEGREHGKSEGEQAARELADLTARVETFERASGVRIDRWESPEKIGRAVRQVMQHGPERIRTRMEHFRKTVVGIAEEIDRELAEDDAADSNNAPATEPVSGDANG